MEPAPARGFETRFLAVANRVLRLALRAALVFLVVAGVILGALWGAQRALGWPLPATFNAIFLDRVQKAEALLYVYDNDTGWKANPHTQLHHVERGPFQRGEPQDVRTRTNSEGFFDREHYIKTPYYRVAFLGDSWVEAQQVDPTQRFTDLVEGYVFSFSKGTKAVETMNFGVSNLGTAQEYGVARTHVAKYRPDEIWIMFNPADDMTDSSPLFTSPPLGPTFQYGDGPADGEVIDIRFGYPHPPPVGESRRRERYGEWVNLSASHVRPFLFAKEDHPAFDTILRETRQCLRLLKKLADSIGAKVTLAYLPVKAELGAAEWSEFVAGARRMTKRDLHLDPALGEQRIQTMAREEGVIFLSLKPLILEKGADVMLQGHFSRTGHHWIADHIARRLLAGECCTAPSQKAS